MSNKKQNAIQTEMDLMDPSMVVPVSKLDADQYSADDIDGTTESIFGSGNMAYASLQASQSDAVLSLSDSLNFSEINTVLGNSSPPNGIHTSAAIDELADNSGQNSKASNVTTDADRNLGQTGDINSGNANTGGGNFSSATVGSVSASQRSSDSGGSGGGGSSLSLKSNNNGQNGNDGENGNTPEVPVANNGQDGNDGQDGQDAHCGGKTININLGDINIDLGDTTHLIDNTLVNLGDIITELTTSITDVTYSLTEIVNNLDINNLLDVSNTINLIQNLTDNLTQNITNIFNGLPGSDPLNIELDVNVLDTVLADVTIPLNNVLDSDINAEINLEPVTDITQQIADLSSVTHTLQSTVNLATKTISDINIGETARDLLSVLNDLSGITGNATDTVKSITSKLIDDGNNPDNDIATNLDVGIIDTSVVSESLDVALNPVEDLVGDIDIAAGVATDLFGDNNVSNHEGDSDITADTNIDIVDEVIAELSAAVPLDPIEEVTGDVDIDLAAAINLLGDTADDVVDDEAGGTGEETLLSEIGDGLEATVENVLDASEGDTHIVEAVAEIANESGSILQDIASNIAESDNDDDAGEDSDVTADIGGDVLDTEIVEAVAEVVIDPVEDVAGDIDTDLGIDTNLLNNENTENDEGDTDLSITPDIDIVDNDLLGGDIEVELDVVEEIVGDVDVELGAATDVFGDSADNIVNDGEGGTGEETLLSEIGDGLESVAEEIIEPIISDDEESVSENIQDVIEEIDISEALNIFANDNAENDDNSEPEADESSTDWTESTIDAGGLFDDVVGNLGGDNDSLPDPVGTIAEGIGVLDVEPELDVGGIGGLFG